MPNGNDKWSQYAVSSQPPGSAAPADKWQQYAVSQPGATPATTPEDTYKPTMMGAAREFGKDVGRGMGFDVDKVERIATDPNTGKTSTLMGGLELGRQLLNAASPWMARVAKDPFHITDPIHAMATRFTTAAGLPDKPGQGYSTPNLGKMVGATANIMGGVDRGAGMGEVPEVGHAAKLIERQVAVNKGRVGLVNDARNAAIRLENAVTGPQGEVGRHAQAVIAADKLDLQRTGSEGKVNTAPATAAAQAVIDKTKIGGVAGGMKTMMGMDEAKGMLTQIGREASKLDRAGKRPEAAASWAEYDALRKATQDRANSLGPQMAKSWNHYSSEFHNFIQLKKGVFGDILEDPNHVGVLRKITGGDVAAQLPEIKQWMKKYGIDPEPIDYAVQQGMKLEDLSQQTKNLFIGKLRAIVRHPLLAGGAAAGASLVGHASGIPGMGFVLPLIVAGKVAGILDAAEMTKLLREISEKVGPEAERVTPPPEGPMALPPSGGEPVGGGPEGVERRTTEGTSPTGEERRQVLSEANRQVQANLRPVPRTEAEAMEEQQRQLDEIVPEYMRKGARASDVGRARKSKGK